MGVSLIVYRTRIGLFSLRLANEEDYSSDYSLVFKRRLDLEMADTKFCHLKFLLAITNYAIRGLSYKRTSQFLGCVARVV